MYCRPLAATALSMGVVIALVPVPAQAAPVDHYQGNIRTTIGVAGSAQRTVWDRTGGQRKVRLAVRTGPKLPLGECHEASFDWRTTAGHYDQRTVRNCKPDGYVETDPGGDGYWQEPSGWDGRTISQYGVWATGSLRIRENGKNKPATILEQFVTFGNRSNIYGAGTDRKPVSSVPGDKLQFSGALRVLLPSNKIQSNRVESAPESCLMYSTTRCKGDS